MKRYLIVKYWLYDEKDIVSMDVIGKKHLLALKDNMCEAIIDTENGTYFDIENNEWKKITQPEKNE